MDYKVFISHSSRDQGLVISLANLLSKFGIKVVVAEWYLTPGEPIERKVFDQIERSDCVVALLTRNGIRSNWVQQEIGFALKTKRPLIPIVEKGVDEKDLGALRDKEYIEYDPYQPRHALIRASNYVQSLKLKKADQERTLLVAGGILAFLLLLSEGER